MSEERDRRVKELFERVLDAPPGEREAILARESRGQSIQGDVRELLETESALAGFLETPASQRVFGAPAAELRLDAGDVVADFTVVAPLGEGGGGVVYEAEQREPRRRVALKVVRTGHRSGDALNRLRDEAANLARLQHPAIGHVYAAGVREHDGVAQPWIAMELIREARGIVRYAREAGLTRDERLGLFVTVCEALHHAHENGVVHRDVAPGNVLVGRDGRPKIVDFGVAQSTGDDALRAAAVGTLAYASPEQLDGSATDRRTDVYGLGALLHELLTGEVPLDVGDLPVADVAHAKRTRPVRPPSARAREIPHDLDAIVLRALAPDPAGRYESAAALAADLTRFLDGEPVAAYGGGSVYHLAKFVRRRRAVAAAVAGIALALVAATAVSVWFAIDNARARDEAEQRSYAAGIAAASAALRIPDVAEARRQLDRAPVARRDWEWRHLAASLDASRATLSFPGRELWAGAASADGRILALAGVDRSVEPALSFAALVRPAGEIVREWRGNWSAHHPSVALGADGATFAAGFADGRIVLHDVARGTDRELAGAHADRVIAVTISPAGDVVASGGADGLARLWTVADGAPLPFAARHPDRVISLAFAPSGRVLVTGCRDGTIRLWDTSSGALVRSIPGHENSVEGVAVSPDGVRIASVSRDQTVRLWNFGDGSVVAVGRSHTSNVRGVAFDPSGASLVSSSWDGTLREWDARTGAELGILRGHTGAVTAVAFVAEEPRIVSVSWDATVKRWQRGRGSQASCRTFGGTADRLAMDPSGARIAALLHDGSVALLDAASASPQSMLRFDGVKCMDLSFAGGERIVAVTDAQDLRFLDARPGADPPREIRRTPISGLNPYALAADRDGASVWVLSWRQNGSDQRAIREVAVQTGRVGEPIDVPGDPVSIGCDGRGTVVVGDRSGAVTLVRDGTTRSSRVAASAIRSLAFDDSRRRLAAATEDGRIVILAADDLTRLGEFEGHVGAVHDVRFLPGGRRLVSASRDQTARIWDATTGECLLVLQKHGYPFQCVAVTPDGRRIATGSGAGEGVQNAVTIWDAPPHAPLNRR